MTLKLHHFSSNITAPEPGTPPSGCRRGQGTPPSGCRRGQGTPPSGCRRGQGTPPSGCRRGQGTPPSGCRRGQLLAEALSRLYAAISYCASQDRRE
ncbi:basic salivary proline-rich protein 2-like [Eumetopias jubatus]|uniref:basic salivary proline-rich protein 2-like n=1 Tax=Eumetopias jubatus TaxID=34886 RepID=UPI0010167646|nr:basic salivary proline-rich protein 2-like [Eumetopias jubatus]